MDTGCLEQSIGLSGVGNARELGGYRTKDGKTVKRGVLLRTAKLSTATESDLRRLSETFRTAMVIDLRSEEEINGAPEVTMFIGAASADKDLLPDGAGYLHLPILDMQKLTAQILSDPDTAALAADMDNIKMMELFIKSGILSDTLYFRFLDEEPGRSNYARLFRELLSLEEGRALLFHCSQGKDRTGVAAMLILSALGADEGTVISDYMLTNQFNSERIAGERAMLERSGRVPPELIDSCLMVMDSVSESTMASLIAHIRERCGSVRDYIIKELGISEEEIEQLRKKFLVNEEEL